MTLISPKGSPVTRGRIKKLAINVLSWAIGKQIELLALLEGRPFSTVEKDDRYGRPAGDRYGRPQRNR